MPVDRREFLRAATLLAGGALSVGCSRALFQLGPQASRQPSRRLLGAAQRARMMRAVDLILPATETPGALDAGVPDFVEMMLADYYYEDERRTVLEGLDSLEARARERHAAGFLEATEQQQVAILAELEREGLQTLQAAAGTSILTGFEAGAPPPTAFFQALRELVAVGFCTSELAGAQLFRFDPVPNRFEGCVPFEAIGRPYVS